VSFGKKILICPILPPMSDLTPFYGTTRGVLRGKVIVLNLDFDSPPVGTHAEAAGGVLVHGLYCEGEPGY
jgi:hypothetical protein